MTLWSSMGSIFRRRSLLRGVGILFVAVLVIFVSVFFFTYFTGGETRLLTLIGGDGVGVVMLEGTINESRGTIQSLKEFGDPERIKGVGVRINSPAVAWYPPRRFMRKSAN